MAELLDLKFYSFIFSSSFLAEPLWTEIPPCVTYLEHCLSLFIYNSHCQTLNSRTADGRGYYPHTSSMGDTFPLIKHSHFVIKNENNLLYPEHCGTVTYLYKGNYFIENYYTFYQLKGTST